MPMEEQGLVTRTTDAYEARRRVRFRRRLLFGALWALFFVCMVGGVLIVFQSHNRRHPRLPPYGADDDFVPLLSTVPIPLNEGDTQSKPGCEVTVLLMRHCEKDIPSVVQTRKSQHCSYIGMERAHFLPTLFETRWPRPFYLYALSPDRGAHKNYREVETLAPLAHEFSLDVDARFQPGQEGDLTNDLFDKLRSGDICGRVIVIAWKHSEIPDLAEALGCSEDIGCPTFYPDNVYDDVWQLKYVYQPQALYGAVSKHTKRSATGWVLFATITQQFFDPLTFSAKSGDYPENGTASGGRWFYDHDDT